MLKWGSSSVVLIFNTLHNSGQWKICATKHRSMHLRSIWIMRSIWIVHTNSVNYADKHLQGYWSYAQASIGHEYPTLHKACSPEKILLIIWLRWCNLLCRETFILILLNLLTLEISFLIKINIRNSLAKWTAIMPMLLQWIQFWST